MTWKWEQQNTIKLGIQTKFIIDREQLDFFSEEFQSGLDNTDCEQDSKDFAEALLYVIGEHLSRRNLRDIINECSKRLEEW